MGETRLIQIEAARELAWVEFGDAGGTPVMAFHGSPGTRNFFAGHAAAATRSGARLIAPDRPGYGHSTYHPARTFETWARDVERLADHLQLDRFSVVGVSSGGPNAASCAWLLGERVKRCALVSSPAPPDADVGDDPSSQPSRLVDGLSRRLPSLLGLVYQFGLRIAHRSPDKAVALAFRSLPAVDASVLARPEISAAMRDELSHPVATTAGRAAVQDLRLERQPWGFALGDIAVGVDVWHGDLDRNVPSGSALYMANEIPGAVLHRLPDDGHLLVHAHFGAILDELV